MIENVMTLAHTAVSVARLVRVLWGGHEATPALPAGRV